MEIKVKSYFLFSMKIVGSWNFGCSFREDKVEIYGNKGKIVFSVFDENPIQLITENERIILDIEHPENVQYYHIKNMRDFFFEGKENPSIGKFGLHTSWVMDKILGSI